MIEQATLLGLEGWVRNCGDGSVEAVVVGPPEHVDLLHAWARRGPAAAAVTAVEHRAATAAEEDDALGGGFRPRPSA